MSEALAQPLSDRPTVEFSLDPAFGWRRVRRAGHVFHFKGHEQSRSAEHLAEEATATGGDAARVSAWLESLDGFFAVAVEGPDWSLAAVDRVRSMPLIWSERSARILVTQDGPWLESRLGLTSADADPEAAGAVALSGFTIGADTLYRDIRQLLPGQYLLVGSAGHTIDHYHQWRPWRSDRTAEPDDLAIDLSRLNRRLIEKLAAGAGGREIVVPLSAGLDSRMILSGLVSAGYPKLRAFAYGRPGNREAVVSREVAARLGVPWHFVPYDNAMVRRMGRSDAHLRYLRYADSLTGIHFPQDYPALRTMLDEDRIGADSVVVNGQSGDFISGNHILPPLDRPAVGLSERDRQKRIVDALIGKHFKLWASLVTPPRLAPIRRRLSEEIASIGGLPPSAEDDHGIYEYCEFIDRQSKYVIHGQRAYEFLGLDWSLPLWDRDYLDFWERAPLAAKRGQTLYREVLTRDNWGGVWRDDLPINPLRIRPTWMVPLRFGLKALHAPLGRARWHRFERQYLSYWMAPLCSFAPWPWRRIAFDRRGHANALAWQAAEYLESKGLGWNGWTDADG